MSEEVKKKFEEIAKSLTSFDDIEKGMNETVIFLEGLAANEKNSNEKEKIYGYIISLKIVGMLASVTKGTKDRLDGIDIKLNTLTDNFKNTNEKIRKLVERMDTLEGLK